MARVSQLPPLTPFPPGTSEELPHQKPCCPADRALMTDGIYPWQPGLRHYSGANHHIMQQFCRGVSCPDPSACYGGGCGSAEQNGYFCAATVRQLNSCFCALTATEGSPAWIMSERAVNNKICMRGCNAQIRPSSSFTFFW